MTGTFLTTIPSSKHLITLTWKDKVDIFEGYANASELIQKGTLSLSSGEVLYGQFKYQETSKHGAVKVVRSEDDITYAEW